MSTGCCIQCIFIIALHLAPSQPVINVITPSTTTLTVRWNDEGFSYRLHVQKKINTFGPVTPPYNITGLESNTEYTVVVEAYNSLGSAIRSVVGYTLPEGEKLEKMLPTVTVIDKLIIGVVICKWSYYCGIQNYFENVCLVSYCGQQKGIYNVLSDHFVIIKSFKTSNCLIYCIYLYDI